MSTQLPSAVPTRAVNTAAFGKAAMLFIGAAAMLALPDVYAAGGGGGAATGGLPTGTVTIPGVEDGADWPAIIGGLIRFIVVIICLSGLGLGMGDSIFSIFRTINDARSSGEWGPAIKQLGSILLGIALALAIFMMMNKFVIDPLIKYFQ